MPERTTKAAPDAGDPRPVSDSAGDAGTAPAADGAAASGATARGAHGRYRRRQLALAEGARLVLTSDGTIVRINGAGAQERAWAVDDPEWPRLAHRFGIHDAAPTIAPTGRPGQDAALRRP